MTLLYFDGFQDVATLLKPEWSLVSGQLAVDSGRDAFTNGGAKQTAQSGGGRLQLALPTSAATCIVGTAIMCPSASFSEIPAIEFCSAAATIQVLAMINASGFIEVRRTSQSGTLLGTSSGHTPVGGSEWVSIQIKAVLHTSTGSVEVKLRGVTVLTITGAATSSTIGNVTHVNLSTKANTGNHTWDDLWVCDAVDATSTQGRANNDYLGDLRVQTLIPSSDGDTTQFTPSTGTNHAALVDEIPPNITDYNADATSGHRDLYNVSDLTNAATVFGVRESIYAAKSDSGVRTMKPLLKENSTVTGDTAQGLAITFGGVFSPFHWVRPSDSAVWTVTDVNALQVGAEVG